MNDELKPVKCGCGGEAQIRQDGTLYYVRCPECGTESADYQFPVEAIEAWNRAMGADQFRDLTKKIERTAKVDCKRYIGTSTGIVGEIKVTGICEICHNAVVDRYSFCPNCGSRLEWE